MMGDTPKRSEPLENEAHSPLSLEFWPDAAPLNLDAMNNSLDWLGDLGHDQGGQGGAPPALPPGDPLGGGAADTLPHGGGGSSSQLQHQQLLHSQLQSLHPMLAMGPAPGGDPVSARASSTHLPCDAHTSGCALLRAPAGWRRRAVCTLAQPQCMHRPCMHAPARTKATAMQPTVACGAWASS